MLSCYGQLWLLIKSDPNVFSVLLNCEHPSVIGKNISSLNPKFGRDIEWFLGKLTFVPPCIVTVSEPFKLNLQLIG